MRLHQSAVAILIAAAIVSSSIETTVVSANNSFTVVSTTTSDITTVETVEYECDFISQWRKERHPNNYPESAVDPLFDAHFTFPHLFAHDRSYEVWSDGNLASSAVENIAEVADDFDLNQDLDGAGATVGVRVVGQVQFASQIRQTLPSLTADLYHQYASSIMMLAPSPDWFTGFHGFSLANQFTNTWFETFVIDVWAWDAGTEQGDDFDYSYPPESPQKPIKRFAIDNLPSNGIFASPDGSTVLPVARYECRLRTEGGGPTETTCLAFGSRCQKNSDCCSGFCAGFFSIQTCWGSGGGGRRRRNLLRGDDYKGQ